MSNKPYILLTNDDGINAHGLRILIKTLSTIGELLVVAPNQPRSGMGHAITSNVPLYLKKKVDSEQINEYECSGTPVDCIKMAENLLLKRKPDLIVSGINHGANSSISVIYSGTMAAAIEGAIMGVPSIGFSITTHDVNADFSSYSEIVKNIVKNVLGKKVPSGVCLNVNIPFIEKTEIKGIKICRQAKGEWKEEFVKRKSPDGKDYYWLTGKYYNEEPDAKDTDEWLLKNNHVTIVPVSIDMTSYHSLETISNWGFYV